MRKISRLAKPAIESRTTTDAKPGASVVYVRNGSGVYLDEQVALQYTALWRAVNLISSTIAGLPVRIGKRVGESRKMLDGDPVWWLLSGKASKGMGARTFKEACTAHVLTWGNGYGEIERRRDDTPVAIHLITPDRVTPDRIDDEVVYRVTNQGAAPSIIPERDMFHLKGLGFDGLTGYSPVRLFVNPIGLGLTTERYGVSFFGNSSRPGGVLTSDKELGDEAREKIRSEWEQLYRGPNNVGRVAILEDGLKWAGVGIPNDVAQFLETRVFQVSELARVYGIPPHMLFDLTKSTNNNIEHQGIEWVRDGLMPWVSRWEEEIGLKLLGEQRIRDNVYVKMNLAALMRGDSASRANFYKTLQTGGVYSINDIRAFEDEDPIPGGDLRLVPMNMVPLEQARDNLVRNQPGVGKGSEPDTNNQGASK